MKIKRIYKRTVWLLAALFLCLFCLFESALSIVASANGSATIKDYDSTRIEDDLSDVNSFEYQLKDYVDIVRVQEYCYTEKAFAEYYGLYIYVFNPSDNIFNNKSVPFKEEGNVVNMATSYDENGNPSEYSNMALEFLDKTDSNRFYKFKVQNASKLYDMAKDYAEKHDGKRRYDLASFQFKKTNGENVVTKQKDITIGKTYIYSGYAAGCALEASVGDSESTLKCESQTLETLKLDVKHTNRLMENYGITHHGDDNICDNLHTAYFSVPERYFTEYGDLQKIKAEWYEYKTSPIFVTSDEDAYKFYKSYLGKDIGTCIPDSNWRVIWDYDYGTNFTGTIEKYYYYWRFDSQKMNNKDFGERYYYADEVENLPRMSWLFYKDANVDREKYQVSASEILEYAKDYKNNQLSGIPLIQGKYSYDLFSSFGNAANGYELNPIDEDRQSLLTNPTAKNGHVKLEIDAGDNYELTDWTDLSFWEKFLAYAKDSDEGKVSASAIVTLNDAAAINEMTAEKFGADYLLGKWDAEKIQEEAIKEIENGNRVVLFRFATTDYVAANARFDDVDVDAMSPEDGFVSQQTVFLDFDIISLTFRDKMEKDTVIGVVSDPVDMFSSIEPGSDMRVDDDWLNELFAVLAIGLGALALLFCAPWLVSGIGAVFSMFAGLIGPLFNLLVEVFKWLFKGIVWVIKTPFKLIGKAFHKEE